MNDTTGRTSARLLHVGGRPIRVSTARPSGKVRIPPIRGRAGELKVIGALIEALARGRGGVLVIEGPPGIGKSRLLTEVLALAEKAGVRALFGEAFEYQQTVPFFSLFMATLRADPPVGDAEALRRLGTSADLRYWVVRDLQAAIHAAAARIPLAILLEDIHWADNATLLALRSLAATRPDAPVLWVLTARTGAGGPAVRETLTALEREDAKFLRLTAMTPIAVADIVQDAVRANADASLLSLADKAHGNPFLLTELLRGLDEDGRLDVSGGRAVATGDTLPRRLSDTMQQRLDQLSDAASQVVRVAAVLPDQFSARLLAAMLERRPAALVSAVEEAVRADLIIEDGDQMRFRHDLLREATRQSLPQSLRRAMERQSASVMLGLGAAPAEVATQLARSAEPGDREAIGALRQAAQSVGRGDASAAADLCKRALELLPADDAEHGSLSPKRWSCSTGPAATARPKSWPSRRSRRRPRPKKRPRFASGSRRSISTVPSDAWRRIGGRSSWAASAKSPGHGIWPCWPTTCCSTNVGNNARPPTRLPRQRHRPVISSRGSWPTSASLVLTVRTGMRAAPYSRLEKACALARASDPTAAHDLVAAHHANSTGGGRPVGRRCRRDRRGNRESPTGTQRDGP